jgi:hypothetical protein
MKTLFLAASFSLILSLSAQAWTPVDSKKLCTTTTQAFEMFKKEKYEPIITSRLQAILVAVWLNPKKEMMVTNTVSVPGQSESLTCIVTLGVEQTFVDIDAVQELGK